MKWNIKLEIKNLTGGQTTRHSLPTRMCFNLFSHRTKILKYLHTLHTFAFAHTHKANTSQKQKSAIFANTLFPQNYYICKSKYHQLILK